jgi:putrescine transport system substrate-binding protein
MKFFFSYLALVLAVFGWPAPSLAQEKGVNVYAWADYFDPAVFDAFTKETGINVTYDTYDTNEAMESRLASGHSGFDIVVVSGPSLQKQIAAGLLQKLEKGKLPAAKMLSPDIMARLAAYDPGNLYAVNYAWFTLGLAFNTQAMQSRHIDSAQISWDAVFRPELLKRAADCGVEVQDSPNDLFALALRFLGLDPHSKSLIDLKRADDLLYGLRRNVKKFASIGDVSGVAGGDACLMIGWSSAAAQARKQAQDSASGVSVSYAVPKGGTLLLLDNLVVPKDAPHAEAAHALINYLMRPDIAARNSKATRFANAIPASKAFLPQDMLTDTAVYPDDATMKAFFTPAAYNTGEQAFIMHEWARVKNGDVKPTLKDAKKPLTKTEKARNHAGRDQR